jgi:hypothetical protein
LKFLVKRSNTHQSNANVEAMAGRNCPGSQGIPNGSGPIGASGSRPAPTPARFLKEWRESAQLQDGHCASQAERAASVVRQSAFLLSFARQNHWLLGPELESLTPFDAGTEHDIFREPATGRAWKITHPGRWQARQEPPTEYLKNLQRLNVIAPPLDIRIEGVVVEGDSPQLVISMEWINGEHPTESWFGAEMKLRGWELIGITSYCHRETGVVIRDAYKDNFILTPEGRLIPIDLSVDPLPQGVRAHFQER